MPLSKITLTLRLLILLAATSPTLGAQQPSITLGTPATTTQLNTWLHSDDPRLIAWAATLAHTNHNATIVAEIPALIQSWSFPQVTTTGTAQADQHRALLALLDTLIQENADVPLPTIRAIEKHLSPQVFILISRKPLTETRNTLHDWAIGPAVGYSPASQRIATMLLAKLPPGSRTIAAADLPTMANLVANTVSAAREELTVHLIAPRTGRGGSAAFDGGCGDSIGRTVEPGWPAVYTYDLVENESDANGPLIVGLDNDRIAARRFEENQSWGSCSQVEPLDDVTRHRLIAYWLSTSPENMHWQPRTSENLVWRGKAAFDRELGAVVAAHNKMLLQTSRELAARGFVTTDDASRYPPLLIVKIECDIDPCPLK